MKNDLMMMADFHNRATDLYNKFMDEPDRELREKYRGQWCEADNTFKVFFGMTLYDANCYFIDNQGNRKI
jgi:hypothetical protein